MSKRLFLVMFMRKIVYQLNFMKHFYSYAIFLQCAKEYNIEPEPISNCATHEHGSNLLKKHGDDTHIQKPTFIPLILLNGSRDNQAAILKNLLLEVCKLIDMPLPPPCLWHKVVKKPSAEYYVRVNDEHDDV